MCKRIDKIAENCGRLETFRVILIYQRKFIVHWFRTRSINFFISWISEECLRSLSLSPTTYAWRNYSTNVYYHLLARLIDNLFQTRCDIVMIHIANDKTRIVVENIDLLNCPASTLWNRNSVVLFVCVESWLVDRSPSRAEHPLRRELRECETTIRQNCVKGIELRLFAKPARFAR